jgi:hypothetical protein
MKSEGDIIHWLFVNDMIHIYSCDVKKHEFMALQKKKHVSITGHSKMETFLGMVVEQSGKQESTKIHLDNYVNGLVCCLHQENSTPQEGANLLRCCIQGRNCFQV